MRINLFSNKRVIGTNAENLAKDFLIKKGFLVLETNFKTRIGEIDIVAYEKNVDCLVFVEVKYRTTNFFGLPQEAVTKAKQKRIINTAFVYLKNVKRRYSNYRFDVLAISKNGEIEHIKNAFCLEQ